MFKILGLKFHSQFKDCYNNSKINFENLKILFDIEDKKYRVPFTHLVNSISMHILLFRYSFGWQKFYYAK